MPKTEKVILGGIVVTIVLMVGSIHWALKRVLDSPTSATEQHLESASPDSPNIANNSGSIAINSEHCHHDVYTCDHGQVYRNHITSKTWTQGEEDCGPVPKNAKPDSVVKHWYSEKILTPDWAICEKSYAGPLKEARQ